MPATTQVTPLRKPTRAPRNPPPLPKHVAAKARLAMRELEALTGLCESTIRSLIAKGEFPAADFRMGTRCVRWSAGAVTAWLESTSRPASN